MSSSPRNASSRIGFFPGSPAPQHSAEVDILLRMVPVFVFAPEFDLFVFDESAMAAHASAAPRERLERLTDAAYVQGVRGALESVTERAHRSNDGGLLFLATALGHFLGAIPNAEHPLLVALYCRSWCRFTGEPDSPPVIAVAMDEFV